MHQPRTAYTTRFAPSPTGHLHLGHAYSALFAASAAGSGRFLVRIEDIDPGRCQPAFEAAILEDLTWLGLDWERPVRRQSEHMADYKAALDRLDGLGLLYPCFCTRKDITDEIARAGHAPHGPDGALYPGTCRSLAADRAAELKQTGQPFALRLHMARAVALAGDMSWTDLAAGPQVARPEMFGDVVLARKDVPTSYHLAVTIDDSLQGIDLVTRGADLFHASHLHRLLQALLGLTVPLWHHHGLLTDEHGKRFAKRDRAATLASMREAGIGAAEIRSLAGFGSGFGFG